MPGLTPHAHAAVGVRTGLNNLGATVVAPVLILITS